MAEQAHFDKDAFGHKYSNGLNKIMESEKVTRSTLTWLSRGVLEATHETGDVSFMNRLLGVLTPMNRKVCILFFKTFTGYSFDEQAGMFTKKSKKRYDKAHAQYVQFMADPLNNIWTWANRHIEIEQKPLTSDKLAKYLTNFRNKTQGQVSDEDILKAVFKAGVSPDAVIAVMEELGKVKKDEPALM